MASQNQKRRRERRDSRRGIDQVVLAGALWLIPVTLFGYVGYRIAVATGADPNAFLPAIETWELLMGIALLMAFAVFGLTLRGVMTAREQRQADEGTSERWTSYRAPQGK
ncbi:MAG: hypothetical protein H6732_17910 [Alphaproteobacteria bacterium]|nr:hypothetical protein [Alphaproteobacteria bacterium]